MADDDGAARILTWNIERKRPSAPTGSAGVELLFGQSPDVMVLTEAKTCFPARDGHLVWCRPLPHPHLEPDDRRVVMWSRNPWTDVDDLGDDALPEGRYVRATTETPLGPLTVVGVCIPWHMSGVSVGTKDRKPWEDHIDYLRLLPSLLQAADGPLVVAGDYNQRIPRDRTRRDAAAALSDCFQGFDVATAGRVEGVDKGLIDHVALTPDLRADACWAWPATVNGVRMSDHAGVGVDVRHG